MLLVAFAAAMLGFFVFSGTMGMIFLHSWGMIVIQPSLWRILGPAFFFSAMDITATAVWIVRRIR